MYTDDIRRRGMLSLVWGSAGPKSANLSSVLGTEVLIYISRETVVVYVTLQQERDVIHGLPYITREAILTKRTAD